jgi:hypothetical protein
MGKFMIFCSLTVLLLASAGLAAYKDYQGPNGNLNVAGNWYVITDSGDPTSRTGATGLPGHLQPVQRHATVQQEQPCE